jgi:hypothetical protein
MISVFGAAAAAMAMAVAAQSEAVINTEGLLALWLCDDEDGDVATDSSGNGMDAEFKSGGGEWVAGKHGGGLEFFAEGWVETDEPVVVDTKGFTMGCWAKPGQPQKAFVNIMASHQEPPQRGISFEQRNQELNVYGFAMGTPQGWTDCGATFRLNTDEWNFMVRVRDEDGKTAQDYLNGEHILEGVCQNDNPVVAATAGFRLANMVVDAAAREWRGVIDEAFVFNRALSEDEVMSLYDGGWLRALAVSPKGKLPTTWASMKGAF